MVDSKRAALAGSMAAGYLLGRSRRTKLAMAVAAYLVSGRLRAKPHELLAAGADKLGDSPQLSQLVEQVRSELLTAGREALKAAVDHRMGTFADSLADRTKALGEAVEAVSGKAEQDEDRDQDEGGDEERDEGEARDREADRDREEDRGTETDDQRRRPRRPRRETSGSAQPQTGAKRTAKRTAKKAPPRTASRRTGQQTPAEKSGRRR